MEPAEKLHSGNVTTFNGFEIPLMGEQELDMAWTNRSPEDCEQYCFGGDGVLKKGDKNSRNQESFYVPSVYETNLDNVEINT